MTINEFKESDNYLLGKWFLDKKREIESWFNDEQFRELDFSYFEYDTSMTTPIYVGFLYFNENDIQYKLEIIIDKEKFIDGVIEELLINLNGYNNEEEALIGTLTKTIEEPELIPDLLITLISEFKDKYLNTNDIK